MTCTLIQYCSGYQIEKIEMGRACSTYGGEERFIQGLGGDNQAYMGG